MFERFISVVEKAKGTSADMAGNIESGLYGYGHE